MQKYKNLDGLRGVAALIVVLCHYSNGFLPALHGWSGATHHTRADQLVATTPLHLGLAGNFAVCVFFVLSGFVLSIKFFQTKSADVLASSASRRYFRLMLPALASVILTYIILQCGLVRSTTAAQLTGSTWLASFWNFTPHLFTAIYQGTIGVFFGNQNSYNTSLWTMHLELFGSFLIFMFLTLFGNAKQRWVFYLAFGSLFHGSYYLAFFLGVLISDIWVNQLTLKERLSTWKVSLPLLVTGLLLGSWYTPETYHIFYEHWTFLGMNNPTTGLFLQILGAALLIVAVLTNGIVSKLLETRPVQFLGRISFSLYLVHLIILSSFATALFDRLIMHFPYLISLAITAPTSIAVTLVIAHYYTKWVDNPSIMFSRTLGNLLLSSSSININLPSVRRRKTAALQLTPKRAPSTAD